MSVRAQRWLLIAVGGVLVVFIAFPILSLFATSSFSEFRAGLRHPLVWPAMRLSFFTTSITLAIVVGFGTPLAWVLARSRGTLAHALETAIQLPIVMPPAVAGVAMLMAFGRKGLLASVIYPEGWSVTSTTAAVVIAEVFVSAPFFVQAGVSAFRRVDATLIVVARTFGASPLRIFFRVALPLAAPGLVAAAAMAWARALGEFGATLMFAGNLEGVTQTIPLAIYTVLEEDLRAAQSVSMVLVVVAFALLLVVRSTLRRSERQGAA